MIVFRYRVAETPEVCHLALDQMGIPGVIANEELDEHSTIVWKDDKFIAIHYSDTQTMELYGTKNTNSLQYYEKRYPKLEFDEVQHVKTKRWK